jgi:hypothetical protein
MCVYVYILSSNYLLRTLLLIIRIVENILTILFNKLKIQMLSFPII